MFVAVGYAKVNQVRAAIYAKAKARGYSLITYVSSKLVQWGDTKIGDNCFIFENQTIQPFRDHRQRRHHLERQPHRTPLCPSATIASFPHTRSSLGLQRSALTVSSGSTRPSATILRLGNRTSSAPAQSS